MASARDSTIERWRPLLFIFMHSKRLKAMRVNDTAERDSQVQGFCASRHSNLSTKKKNKIIHLKLCCRFEWNVQQHQYFFFISTRSCRVFIVSTFSLKPDCKNGKMEMRRNIFFSFKPCPPPPLLSTRKYKVIGSPEQRQRYKNDFNAEYSEYRGLHARMEGITRQFTVLDNELKQLQPGTDRYKVASADGSRCRSEKLALPQTLGARHRRFRFS